MVNAPHVFVIIIKRDRDRIGTFSLLLPAPRTSFIFSVVFVRTCILSGYRESKGSLSLCTRAYVQTSSFVGSDMCRAWGAAAQRPTSFIYSSGALTSIRPMNFCNSGLKSCRHNNPHTTTRETPSSRKLVITAFLGTQFDISAK
jgi:hypothetical protein